MGRTLLFLLAFIVIAGIACAIEIYRELHKFVTVNYEVKLPKLSSKMPEKKVVLITDLHNNEYGDNNEILLDAIRKENPDLMLCAGDMLVGNTQPQMEKAVRFLERAAEIAPIYYANGNHEQRMKEHPAKYGDAYEMYKESLMYAGIHLLENDSTTLLFGNDLVKIYGLEIPEHCYSKRGRQQLKAQDIRDRLGEPDPDICNILIAHHPEYAKTYWRWGADLVVSGHLHGGVIRIPRKGGLISPQLGLFPHYSGDMHERYGQKMVVSRGLGTHTIKIRLFNPAELVVLHIKGEKA